LRGGVYVFDGQEDIFEQLTGTHMKHRSRRKQLDIQAQEQLSTALRGHYCHVLRRDSGSIRNNLWPERT
jgi:hypothetical protein